MRTSDSIASIAKAMAAFQSEVKQPEKTGVNPHFKSKFVTLDDTVKVIHEHAPKHGLSFTQMPVSNEQGVGVITLIMHESGEFIEMPPFILPMDKKTAQAAGSATTYAKRYSLSAAFGIVSDVDDDGNEATDNAPQNPPKQASSKQVGMIKAKVLEYAKLRGRTPQDVYKVLNITMTDLETLSSKDASDMIKTVDGWINKAKDEQQGA